MSDKQQTIQEVIAAELRLAEVHRQLDTEYASLRCSIIHDFDYTGAKKRTSYPKDAKRRNSQLTNC